MDYETIEMNQGFIINMVRRNEKSRHDISLLFHNRFNT